MSSSTKRSTRPTKSPAPPAPTAARAAVLVTIAGSLRRTATDAEALCLELLRQREANREGDVTVAQQIAQRLAQLSGDLGGWATWAEKCGAEVAR